MKAIIKYIFIWKQKIILYRKLKKNQKDTTPNALRKTHTRLGYGQNLFERINFIWHFGSSKHKKKKCS